MSVAMRTFVARLRLFLGTWLLLGIGPSAPAGVAAPPRPRNAERLVVVNDDGFSAFFSGEYRTAEDLRRKVRRLSDTQVAVLEWCIVAGSRVNFPARGCELIGTG